MYTAELTAQAAKAAKAAAAQASRQPPGALVAATEAVAEAKAVQCIGFGIQPAPPASARDRLFRAEKDLLQ